MSQEGQEQEDRESIWSIRKDDLSWYSVLFPVLWLVGIVNQLFLIPWGDGWTSVISLLIAEVGKVGLSAAVLSLIILAGRRAAMPLFDWTYDKVARARAAQEKGRQEGRQEAEEQAFQAWEEWRKQGDINAPPPGRKYD